MQQIPIEPFLLAKLRLIVLNLPSQSVRDNILAYAYVLERASLQVNIFYYANCMLLFFHLIFCKLF